MPSLIPFPNDDRAGEKEPRESDSLDASLSSLSNALAYALERPSASDEPSLSSAADVPGTVQRTRSALDLIPTNTTSYSPQVSPPQSSDGSPAPRSASVTCDGRTAASAIASAPPHVPLGKHCLMPLSPRTCASAMKELARRGLSERAEELFQLVRSSDANPILRSTFVYNAAIALLSDGGRSKHSTLKGGWRRGLDLLEEMNSIGLSPSVHTYTSLMHALMRGWKLDEVLKLYDRMRNEQLSPNVITYSTLISAYGKLRRWRQVLLTLQQMSDEGVKPNLWTYNNVMFALNSSQQWNRTLEVYNWLSKEDVRMNTFSYNAVLNACSQLNDFSRAIAVASEMRANAVRRDEFTYGALMAVSERTGNWQQALELLHEAYESSSCSISTVMCNTAISACVQAGEWQQALSIHEWMPNAECMPDVVTHTVMLGALNQGGMWHSALSLAMKMSSDSASVDRIFALKALDVLFSSGLERLQKRALALLKHYQQTQLVSQLPDLVQQSGGSTASRDELELTLAGVSFGAAFLSLYAWLRDADVQMRSPGSTKKLSARIAVFCCNWANPSSSQSEGLSGCVNHSALEVTGEAESHEDSSLSQSEVKDQPEQDHSEQQPSVSMPQSAAYKAMLEMSKQPGFPFRREDRPADETKPTSIRFVAEADELVSWLQSGALDRWLLPHLRCWDTRGARSPRAGNDQPHALVWTQEDTASQELDRKASDEASSQLEALMPEANAKHKGMSGTSFLSLSASARPFTPGSGSKMSSCQAGSGGFTWQRCGSVQALARLMLAMQSSSMPLRLGASEFHRAVVLLDKTKSDSHLDETCQAAIALHATFSLVQGSNLKEKHEQMALAEATGMSEADLIAWSKELQERVGRSDVNLVSIFDVRNVLWTRLGGLPPDLVDHESSWSQQLFEPGVHTARSLVHDVVFDLSLLSKHNLLALAAGVVCAERIMLGKFPVWPACLEVLTGMKGSSPSQLASAIAAVNRFAFGHAQTSG